MDGKWFIDFKDSEVWDTSEEFNTPEEAIKYGKDVLIDDKKQPEESQEYFGRESFKIGQLRWFKPVICIETLIENLQDNAYDTCGEVSDGYLDIKDEDINKLSEMINETLDEWANKTGNHATFGTIENVKTIYLNDGK